MSSCVMVSMQPSGCGMHQLLYRHGGCVRGGGWIVAGLGMAGSHDEAGLETRRKILNDADSPKRADIVWFKQTLR